MKFNTNLNISKTLSDLPVGEDFEMTFSADFNIPETFPKPPGEDDFNVDFGAITEIGTAEVYDGTCVVVPDIEDEHLPTKDKVMPDDVTVKAVPTQSVDNLSGGKTITIGG